jgi:hypothetical protein
MKTFGYCQNSIYKICLLYWSTNFYFCFCSGFQTWRFRTCPLRKQCCIRYVSVISGCHSSVHEDGSLLACCIVSSLTVRRQMFQTLTVSVTTSALASETCLIQRDYTAPCSIRLSFSRYVRFNSLRMTVVLLCFR